MGGLLVAYRRHSYITKGKEWNSYYFCVLELIRKISEWIRSNPSCIVRFKHLLVGKMNKIKPKFKCGLWTFTCSHYGIKLKWSLSWTFVSGVLSRGIFHLDWIFVCGPVAILCLKIYTSAGCIFWDWLLFLRFIIKKQLCKSSWGFFTMQFS